ncbi:MAG: hypothetical protein U0X91_05000 [Spirosomataceae bacterium]
MDKELLVDKLKTLFRQAEGVTIDTFGLAPAYGGLLSNVFVLGISAPSMAEEEPSDKIQTVINLLFAGLEPEERRMIDRVRIYNTAKELQKQARYDFEAPLAGESYLNFSAEIFKTV